MPHDCPRRHGRHVPGPLVWRPGALDSDAYHKNAVGLDSFLALSGLRWQFPWAVSLLKRVPIARLRQFLGVSDRMYDFGRHAYADYVKMFGQSQHGHYKPDDPVARLLACNSKGNATLSPDEIGAEVGSLLIAGTDPVGTTLAFAAWELGRNPEWQDILRRPSGAEGQRRPLRSRCSPAMARYWESR